MYNFKIYFLAKIVKDPILLNDMNKLYPIFFVPSFLFFTTISAQIGGSNVYEFLRLAPSARVTGLGSTATFIVDDDISLGYGNPALLNPSMHNQLSFSHLFHMAGIGSGYAAFGRQLSKLGITAQGGIQYTRYGNFSLADEFGIIQGDFDAADYAINIGASRPLYDKLTLGVNLKFITSQLESYNSFGLAADIGAVYADTVKNFTMSLVFKNAGMQLSKYDAIQQREDLPFEIQAAFAKKLRHLPLRVSATFIHLERWNILYDDPNIEDDSFILLGEEEPPEESKIVPVVDNLFRHIVFAGEFLFGKKENLRLRVAYSHLKRKELSVQNFRGLAGFSMGAGIKISKFRLEYGKSFYHLAGSNNHITINVDIQSFKSKKKRSK